MIARINVPVLSCHNGIVLVVVFLNASEIPEVLRMIFASAFGIDSVFGSVVGAAVMWGVKRGIYSNEAGQGTGPHAAAAAEVSHPAKQGFVQAFAVYIDTLFVCTATAFLIISTDMYQVFQGPDEELIYSGSVPEGTDYGLWTKQVPMLNTGNDANLGDPSAVAAVVAMAASDDGAFLTGTEIRIDGGAHC